jgi:hypothetical protein
MRLVESNCARLAVHGVAFLIVAVVDFTRDSSGMGVVFLVFAAVFLRLGLLGKRRQPRSSLQGD